MSDEELIELWISKGGAFHGPRVETGTMPQHLLLPFLREIESKRISELEKDLDELQTEFAQAVDIIEESGVDYDEIVSAS